MEEIKVVDIEDLVQDDKNFNKGTAQGKKLMKSSLERFGAGRSVLIDKNNRLIAGNKTAENFAEIGQRKVIIVETDGDALVAVKRKDVDLDSPTGREMALADNVTSAVNLDFDEDLIKDVAAETGFAVRDWLDELPDMPDADKVRKVKEDAFDDNKDAVPTICQPGDVCQLGRHRLMCGDSTCVDNIERLMDGRQADLWLTDPPYNVAVRNSQGMTIKNDNMKSDDFYTFLSAAFQVAERALKPGGSYYVWFASCEHISFERALNNCGLQVRQEILWNKNHFTLGRQDYQWKHEPCLYGWKDGAAHYWIGTRNQSSVIPDADEVDIEAMKKEDMKRLLQIIYNTRLPTTVIDEQKPAKDADHPTMKPVRLFAYLINNSSTDGQIVLDTFGGSGTTIIACEQLDRTCYMMELDPHYCDVIIARWEKMTGNKATKVNQMA